MTETCPCYKAGYEARIEEERASNKRFIETLRKETEAYFNKDKAVRP